MSLVRDIIIIFRKPMAQEIAYYQENTMRICLEICFQHNSASAFDSLPLQHLWPPPVLSSFTPVSPSEADTHTLQ